MALSKSIKMYLTLFVATTCVYMVLYQYHISREPIPSPELMKNKLIPAEAVTLQSARSGSRISTASLVKRYNLFLWSPLSLMTTLQSSPSPSPSPPHSSMSETAINTTTNTPSSTSTTTTTAKTAKTTSILPNLRSSFIITPLLPSSSPLSSLALLPLSPSSSSSSVRLPSSSSLSSPLSLSAVTSVKSSAATLARNRTSQQNPVEIHLQPLTLDSNTTNRTATTTKTTKTKIITTPRTTTTTRTSTRTLNKTLIRDDNKFDNNKNNTNKMTRATTTATASAKKFAASSVPPPLYIITPTYRRPEQLAELTRLGYTLKHVANLLWLVIEDANKTSPLVTRRLEQIGVPFEYLVAPMPEEYKTTKKAKPRGVSNRNRGLQWLRKNATEGVFYFADDDNTYDITIFEQMRYTKKVSMWPVGLVTKFGVSSPIIKQGKITGFYDGWIGGRKYPIDMAGFAVSVNFLNQRPDAKMPYKPGYEEDGFLKSLAPLNNTEIDLLASNCTEILTWHTQTKRNGAAQPLNMTKYGDTNLVTIDKSLIRT